MGILNGNPKEEPLHYGEISAIWAASLAAKSLAAGYSTLLNHAGDEDLKKVIQEGITLSQAEALACDEMLREYGIAVPPAVPEKPEARLEDIPDGARFQDVEIAATLSRDIGVGLMAHSQAMAQCIREDVAAMFATAHAAKVTFGATVLRLNKEKAWIVVPPLRRERELTRA